MSYQLSTPLAQVRGLGPTWVNRLAKHDIHTVADFLLLLPIRYDDRSITLTINQLGSIDTDQLLTRLDSVANSGQNPTKLKLLTQDKKASDKSKIPTVTIRATVTQLKMYWKGTRSVQSAWLHDETGRIKATWFNSPFVMTTLREGETYLFAGKYSSHYSTLTQPSIEKIDTGESIHTGRLVPIYTSTIGIKPGMIRRLLQRILDQIEIDNRHAELIGRHCGLACPKANGSLQSQKSMEVINADGKSSTTNNQQLNLDENQSLLSLSTALSQLHFPDSADSIIVARERLALEELLVLLSTSQRLTKTWQKTYQSTTPNLRQMNIADLVDQHKLPFQLTNSQQIALQDLLSDLSQPYPMNRLLLGEVGSGKTVVAGLIASYLVSQGQTCCFLAPTRILAQQHASTLANLFPTTQIKLLTSQSTFDKVAQPTLLVGTHKLFNHIHALKPALVIIDEQQRFGVSQRTDQVSWTSHAKHKLLPHVLTMTATPIPRSLLLTIFRHIQVSTLTELPFPRQVKTYLVPNVKRTKAITWLRKQLMPDNSLLIVVCPLVDPNTKAAENASAAIATFQDMQKLFSDFPVGLLHGQQKKSDQANVLDQLHHDQLKILVATSLVEVGVDLPQATHLWIENADRFGLSSLHQLRGRVGRRGQEGHCLLFTNSTTDTTRSRLQLFSTTTDGFRLAEADLKQRGAGDIFGTKQHGWGGLRFSAWTNANLLKLSDQINHQLPSDWHSPLEAQFLSGEVEGVTN